MSAEHASAHLVTRVPRVRAEEAVAVVLDQLRGVHFDVANVVYVVDAQNVLVGRVPLAALLRADGAAAVGTFMTAPVPRVAPDTDQEHVAHEAIAHGASAVAVVDRAGRLLGVVPAEALIAILYREHVEDLHRLAGMRHEVAAAEEAVVAPPPRRARDRLPWLLVGLAGSVLATLVMAGFEAALEARVAIAFFVPGIVYLADAIGTQTETITVRRLSLARFPLRRFLLGELGTGFLIGCALAALTFPTVLVALGDAGIALAVSVTLIAAGTVATTIGLVLPWALARLGHDPAIGSGPLATIVQDVLSLVIYFALASLLVR